MWNCYPKETPCSHRLRVRVFKCHGNERRPHPYPKEETLAVRLQGADATKIQPMMIVLDQRSPQEVQMITRLGRFGVMGKVSMKEEA